MSDTDVLIAGAGPTGLVLALWLQRLGVRVRIVDKAANDHDFVPEMYVALDCPLFHGAVGDPTGAIPMVGYGAGVFILHVLQRETLSGERPNAPAA